MDNSYQKSEPATQNQWLTPWWLALLATVSFVVIHAIDLMLPLGVAGGVPYVAVVLLGWWFPKHNHIIILAGISTALTIAGDYLSPQGVIHWIVHFNRILALFAIWISAGLLILAKTAMKNLKRSEERFKALFENLPLSIHIKDRQGRYLLANKAYRARTGKSLDEIKGKTVFDFFPEDVANAFIALDSEVLDSGQTITREVDLPTPFDGLRKILVTKFPILNPDGVLETLGVINVDITQQKQIENAIISSKEEAERANNAKSNFLSSMSHELRTPLNAILGFTQLLNTDDDHPLTEKQIDATEQILKSGDHLLSLIEDILDLAVIESEKVSLDAEPQDPTPVIKACVAISHTLAEQKGLTFFDRTAGWNLPQINIDATRFQQVLLNLLSNAVKYNRDSGTVTLSVGEGEGGGEAGAVRFSVTDSGRGIAEEKHGQIFAPFSRLGLENSDITGTGIGLTITRELTEAMGGAIGFESTLGMGSTFWLEFPIVSGKLTARNFN